MARQRANKSNLQTAYWNANGTVLAYREEIIEFLHDYNLDVFLINETWLKPSRNLRIPNYNIFRDDRTSNKGGGTAIFVKSNIDHCLAHSFSSDNIESTAVKINTSSGPIKFISVYSPPKRQLITSELDSLLSENVPTIIAGDLNAKHGSWNSQYDNKKGRDLAKYALSNSIAIDAPDLPTLQPPNGRPDVIDIIILKDTSHVHSLKVLHDLASDHSPILLTLTGGSNPLIPHNPTRKKIKWPKLIELLNSATIVPTSIPDEESLNTATSTLINSIKSCINEASVDIPNDTSRHGIPEEIKDLIREKNLIRKEWQKSCNPIVKMHYNRLSREVRDALSDFRNERWHEFISSLENDRAAYWKLSKTLRKPKTRISPLQGPNGVVYSTADKAEAFADSLEAQFTPITDHDDPSFVSMVDSKVASILNTESDDLPIKFTTPNEIKKIINSLKTKKAPGPDGISNKVLKCLPLKGICALTAIYNASLRLSCFPIAFKQANVILIPKPGKDPLLTSNHRPISLLPCLGKILEKIILVRLESFISENKILPDFQHGFRSGHSSIHQLLRVVEIITEGFNINKHTVILTLDIRQAFDRVWHNGLLYKMYLMGFPISFIKMVYSYLTDRTFRVKIDEILSSERPLKAGVPQGGSLSPKLFNVYSSDIPPPMNHNVKISQFADDTNVISSSTVVTTATRRVQLQATLIEDYCKKWRISINPTKSAATVFSRRLPKQPPNIILFGEEVPWEKSIKYLGVTLDSKLTWAKHINEKVKSANKSIAALYPMLGRNSRLSSDNKLLIYKTTIRSGFTYAAPVWGHAAETHLNKLQTLQNKAIRLALNAPKWTRVTTLHKDTNIPLIKELIVSQSEKFYAGLAGHENPTINSLAQYSENEITKYKKPKVILRKE